MAQIADTRLRAIGKKPALAAGLSSSSPTTLSRSIPSGWQYSNLDDLCTLVTSGPRGWAEFYEPGGSKFIRAQNIRFGSMRLDEMATVKPPRGGHQTRAMAAKGDLLVVITGAGVTNPAILEQDLGEAYISQHVALLKPVLGSVNKEI